MAASDKRGVLATIGVGVLLVLCCAAPVMLAAGALGVLGAWLRNPWVIGAALAAALFVAWQTWTRVGDTAQAVTGPVDPASQPR